MLVCSETEGVYQKYITPSAQYFMAWFKALFGVGAFLQLIVNYKQCFCSPENNRPNGMFALIICSTPLIAELKTVQINKKSILNISQAFQNTSDGTLSHMEYWALLLFIIGAFADAILYTADTDFFPAFEQAILSAPIILQNLLMIHDRYLTLQNTPLPMTPGLLSEPIVPFVSKTERWGREFTEFFGTLCKTLAAFFSITHSKKLNTPLALLITLPSFFLRRINYDVSAPDRQIVEQDDHYLARFESGNNALSPNQHADHPTTERLAYLLSGIGLLSYVACDLIIYTSKSKGTFCLETTSPDPYTSYQLLTGPLLPVSITFSIINFMAYIPNNNKSKEKISTKLNQARAYIKKTYNSCYETYHPCSCFTPLPDEQLTAGLTEEEQPPHLTHKN